MEVSVRSFIVPNVVKPTGTGYGGALPVAASQNNATDILQNCSGLLPRGERSWYAVETRGRFEKAICASLRTKGLETFLPLHSSQRQWSDRRQLVELPIFPR